MEGNLEKYLLYYPYMRKYHKKQILDLLKTLDKVVNNMKGLLLNKQFPTLINLLADCQDGAVNISEFIKEVHREGTKTEQLLAGFSETLYKASVELKLDFIEQLKKQLAAIEASVNIELKPNKIEAVFLPYKASMWDSLESIYLAAKDDPDCDAYVVPIPYYDKKGGKFTEMHWETTYPKDIPLLDYRKYNIEERHPDVIFVHNPYDNCNIVTSVHPDFYCEKLRSFTDCLVYVPYFVGDGTNIQSHFCTLPGCIFAHKVIAQTEEERRIYVREYNKVEKGHENKFLALGSPKLDKAVSAKRDDYETPAEWEKLISNADGSRKKLVFYNTTIGALLQYTIEDNKPSNRYLQMVRCVLNFFKKQNNSVLLWRPHPLLEGTIRSMRPWLVQEYAKIVEEYKREGYGIYDDSEDLNRAVALSDIYYGDASSVVSLFETAKKPVVWQALGIQNINGLYEDSIYLWFINSFNMLYRHNKQNKEVECMGRIPAQRNGAYIRIVENNKKLYFGPVYDDGTFVFDMEKKVFEQLKLNYETQNIISFKNFIYFIPPYYSSTILKLNTDTGETTYLSEWSSKVSGFSGCCAVENEIIFIIQNANALMLFNMESGEYVIEKLGMNLEIYHDICFDGQNYYLSAFYESCIVKWNRKTKDISKIKLPSSFSKKASGQSFFIQYANKHVWLFPFAANNAYKINVNTNKITELSKLTGHFEDKNLLWYYNHILVGKNVIYASTPNKGIVEYDINTDKLNFIKPPSIEPEITIESNLLPYLSKYEIPKEWENQKVVFYNSLTEPTDDLLEFFKRQNNAVLFLRSSDESRDLNRAVAISDIYYGDGSNVRSLFNMVKKPVLLQLTVIVGIFDDENFVWFMNYLNMFYRYDKEKKEIEYMGTIPKQKGWAYFGIIENNRKLYFAPYLGDKIFIFDIDRKDFEQMDFSNDGNFDRKFGKVISFKNFVYFFPGEFSAIMRLNTDTYEILYLSKWVNDVSKLKRKELSGFFSYHCIVDSEIALIINRTNSIMFFNMETCSYEIKSIGEKSEQYATICRNGQNYYITSLYENYIIKWDRQTNEILKIMLPSSFSRKENHSANFLIQCLNEHIWLFPIAANNAYKINVNTNEITELLELTEYFDKNLAWHYSMNFLDKNIIYASTSNNGIVEYNTNTRELNFIYKAEHQLIHYLNENDTNNENFGKKIWEHIKKYG